MKGELRKERLKKLEILKEKGINPFAQEAGRTHTIEEVLKSFEKLESDATSVTIAGRIMSIREHGGSVFLDLYDGSGRMQAYLKQDDMDTDVFKLFNDTTDVGDFINVTGNVFKTKRGQQSVLVKDWKMLTKSLAPLPDKWHGIKDDELRYRQRHLDILMNPELKSMFEKKARFWQEARWFLIQNGFTEVQTPTLELTTGGAEANPFITHHDDFDL
ncbi:lysine--tRNA ligase, partial [Patescibacteria group bacterium]|nr:lysine--tRNA ligase [Patescibacteria group bacterium]